MDFLVIDDDKTFRDATCMLIEAEGHGAEGAEDGEIGMERVRGESFDAVLLDVNLGALNGLDLLPEIAKAKPNLPVVLFTAGGSIKTAVEAMRRGAVDFLEKPFTREQLHAVLGRLRRLHQLGKRVQELEQEVTETKAGSPGALFDFTTPEMKEAMDILTVSAKTNAKILILGESGTGKSVAARFVHDRSHLATKPFVTVSCPSLSKELLESELFGHVKGSFTGAVKDHWGKVKAADGGTLFLDEIGDLPLEIQPKLLRLLNEREYERLGENITRKADVRVIAATNRDLKQRVAEGLFREDLFYRLQVITVEMPPLRERHGDLDRFANHYLKHFAAECGRNLKGFDESAMASIHGHAWPGNLRELRNAVERAVILARGERVTATDFPEEMRYAAAAPGKPVQANAAIGMPMTLDQLEEAHIRAIVSRANSLADAAAILGIDQATLYRKRKKFGME